MNWSQFYLLCFAFGFGCSLLAFLTGAVHLHLPIRWHLPHGWSPHAGGHSPVSVCHGGSVARTGGPSGTDATAHPTDTGVSAFNFFTGSAFLAWFGGAGYLLTRYSHLWAVVSLAGAGSAGLVGALAVFGFLAKVLSAHEAVSDPLEYERVGAIARVSSSIRAGGTGEIIYVLGGTRQTSGARSESGEAIAKGEEVVVTRYERGIAYVRLWREFAAMDDPVGRHQVESQSVGLRDREQV